MASLKWIRIETCLLSDQKIEQLYQMPSGRRMVLIWILIICLAGKSNQRGCLLCGKEPYTVKMMANSFRESETFLKKTLQIFLKLELLGYENGTYFIPNWEKHQSEDKLEKQRENNRLRQQNFRERQREKILETSRYRNVTVTPQNKNKKENKNNIYNNLINNPSPSLDNMVEQDISNEHNPVYEETNPTVQPTPDGQPRTSVPTTIPTIQTTPSPPFVRGGAERRCRLFP